MASEFDLIARHFSQASPPGMVGVGDDCAIFTPPAGHQVVTSTDLLLEGRHFFPDVDPRALGHKALAVNLSDLAAMGATPTACVLGVGLPQVDEPWLAAFAQGFLALAGQHACPLLGGDTTRSSHGLVISVTVFGTVVPGQALLRSAGQCGDDVWVSGSLGAADLAYRLLAGLIPADAQRLRDTRQALEWPTPRIGLGQALAGVAHAALDISDGLLQDLGHILTASGLGADLCYDAMPAHPALTGLPEPVVSHAVLAGGDVYELCFTASPGRREDILAIGRACAVPLARVGTLRSEAGISLSRAGKPMALPPASGFDHFSEP